MSFSTDNNANVTTNTSSAGRSLLWPRLYYYSCVGMCLRSSHPSDIACGLCWSGLIHAGPFGRLQDPRVRNIRSATGWGALAPASSLWPWKHLLSPLCSLSAVQ